MKWKQLEGKRRGLFNAFLMFCCPCILQRFLANNQLDAPIPFNIFIYFQLYSQPSHDTATNTERQLPEAVLIQFGLS
jgi:hypothetical protein